MPVLMKNAGFHTYTPSVVSLMHTFLKPVAVRVVIDARSCQRCALNVLNLRLHEVGAHRPWHTIIDLYSSTLEAEVCLTGLLLAY